MSGLFSKPKAPPPPKAVETKVSEREKAMKVKEDEQAQTLKARQRARLTGGRKMLLASSRTNPAGGIEFETTNTLGYGRNPRG